MPDIAERLREEAGRDDIAYRTVTVLLDAALTIEQMRVKLKRSCEHTGRTHHSGGWHCPNCDMRGPADATTAA